MSTSTSFDVAGTDRKSHQYGSSIAIDQDLPVIVAVIPARGGSKRIPQKNIKEFCGRPIIAYSIEAAIKSDVFDKIIVSTDCDKIAQIAIEYGAVVPFRRPLDLADDFTPTLSVVRHALLELVQTGTEIHNLCCIYPTAPFIQQAHLQRGLDLIKSNMDLEFAFPITSYPYSIWRSLEQHNSQVKMFFPQHLNSRSQDLPAAWHDAGQFYWGTTEAWKASTGIFTSNVAGIPIPRHLVQDIDTLEDWKRAELIYQCLQAELASEPNTS